MREKFLFTLILFIFGMYILEKIEQQEMDPLFYFISNADLHIGDMKMVLVVQMQVRRVSNLKISWGVVTQTLNLRRPKLIAKPKKTKTKTLFLLAESMLM